MPTISVDGAPPREMTAEELTGTLTQQECDVVTGTVVRMKRDERLRDEVDPIVTNPLRWDELTTDQQNAWKQYRTDLLNITDQAGFPHSVTWPTKP